MLQHKFNAQSSRELTKQVHAIVALLTSSGHCASHEPQPGQLNLASVADNRPLCCLLFTGSLVLAVQALSHRAKPEHLSLILNSSLGQRTTFAKCLACCTGRTKSLVIEHQQLQTVATATRLVLQRLWFLSLSTQVQLQPCCCLGCKQ